MIRLPNQLIFHWKLIIKALPFNILILSLPHRIIIIPLRLSSAIIRVHQIITSQQQRVKWPRITLPHTLSKTLPRTIIKIVVQNVSKFNFHIFVRVPEQSWRVSLLLQIVLIVAQWLFWNYWPFILITTDPRIILITFIFRINLIWV